jgi:hypothetical protein
MACYSEIVRRDAGFALAYYNEACVLALKGRSDEALRRLARAIELDSSLRGEAAEDEDLASLRGEDAFRSLLGGGLTG